MSNPLDSRFDNAKSIVRNAAATAVKHFREIEKLSIEIKGFQDVVSNADKEVELEIREALESSYPEDGIVGEEFDNKSGTSGYTWVIDPIDGTANFVAGMPCWAVVLACVQGDKTVIGVVYDPVVGEFWSAARGAGAFLNESPIRVATAASVKEGSTGVGLSNRVPRQLTINLLEKLVGAGGIFYRNASGALMLAYVAGGRLIGYCEPHMNAWDCLASMLMIEEAGGSIYPYSMPSMLEQGAAVIAAAPDVYAELLSMCDEAYAKA